MLRYSAAMLPVSSSWSGRFTAPIWNEAGAKHEAEDKAMPFKMSVEEAQAQALEYMHRGYH